MTCPIPPGPVLDVQALAVATWMWSSGVREFSVREVHMALRARQGFSGAEAAHRAREVLCRHGMIERLLDPSRPGRPSVRYRVLPPGCASARELK